MYEIGKLYANAIGHQLNQPCFGRPHCHSPARQENLFIIIYLILIAIWIYVKISKK